MNDRLGERTTVALDSCGIHQPNTYPLRSKKFSNKYAMQTHTRNNRKVKRNDKEKIESITLDRHNMYRSTRINTETLDLTQLVSNLQDFMIRDDEE